MADQALATRSSGGVTAASDNPLVRFRGQLEQRSNEFKMALPSHIKPEQFQRTIITAVQSDPDLLTADRQSLILACMKAAQDGLLPDKREAALVIYKENKKVDGQWVQKKAVQYLPMVYGLRKKILQSREVTDITAKVVYRREFDEGSFIYEEGTESALRHRPLMDLTTEEAADSNIIAAYSMATYKDGSKSYEVMRRFEIDKVRESSQTGATRDRKGQPRTPSGPWVDWFPEQAKKTVLRRHSKTLPQSGDVIAAIDIEERDDALYANSASAALAVEPDAPRLVPPTRAEVAEEQHDPETGEVIQEEDAEAIARRLDAETLREVEGRDDGTNDGTLADENPSASEGPADEQRGDAHTDADEDTDPRLAMVAGIISDLKIAAVAADIKAADKRFVQHRAAMSEDQVAEIEAAAAAAKARIAAATKGEG